MIQVQEVERLRGIAMLSMSKSIESLAGKWRGRDQLEVVGVDPISTTGFEHDGWLSTHIGRAVRIPRHAQTLPASHLHIVS